MNPRSIALMVAPLFFFGTASCGATSGAPPPGVAGHLPGATQDSSAKNEAGVCRMVSTQQLRKAFGGTISAANLDDMTPGMDRCTWTVSGSRLANSPFAVVAYSTPLVQGSRPRRTSNEGRGLPTSPVAVGSLGPSKTWDGQHLDLAWTRRGRSYGLEIVPAGRTHVAQARALQALITLAPRS